MIGSFKKYSNYEQLKVIIPNSSDICCVREAFSVNMKEVRNQMRKVQLNDIFGNINRLLDTQ